MNCWIKVTVKIITSVFFIQCRFRRYFEEVFLETAASVPGAPLPLWSPTSSLSQRVRTTYPRHQVRQVNSAALRETCHGPTAPLANNQSNTWLAGDSSLCLFMHPVCPPDEAEKLPTWSLLALSTVCLLQQRTQTQPRDPKTRAISRSGQKQKLSGTVKYSKGHLGWCSRVCNCERISMFSLSWKLKEFSPEAR